MRTVLSAAIAMICLGCGGADLDTHEGVAEAMLDHFDKLADVLEGIDSKEAADDAAGELEELGEEMAKIAEAMQKLGDPDKEADKALNEKYKQRMMEASMRLGKAGQKAGPYIAQSKKCQEAWERVNKKMSKLN